MSPAQQAAEPTGGTLLVQSIDLGLRAVIEWCNLMMQNLDDHGELKDMFIADLVRTSRKLVGVILGMNCGDVIRKLRRCFGLFMHPDKRPFPPFCHEESTWWTQRFQLTNAALERFIGMVSSENGLNAPCRAM